MTLLRRSSAGVLGALLFATALLAQPPGADRLELYAYTLRHQRASEVPALIYPLLSPRGTVEVRPGDNTVVVRDTPASVARIVPLLRSFDHPARPLRVEIRIVRALRVTVSPPVQRSDLPEDVTRRLRALLPYDVYETKARTVLSAMEGQSVAYSLGQEYEVRFRLGTLLEDRRAKLSDFQIHRQAERAERRSGEKPVSKLIHTNLNLWLDRPVNLALAKDESSLEALLVMVTLRRGETRSAP
jgi:hypothetical protein